MAAAAFIVDLDGTIWDSHQWVADLVSVGDSDVRESVLEKLRAGRPAATLLRRSGTTPARFRELCAASVTLRLYSGAKEVLSALCDRGLPLGVVTNLPRWMAMPMLASSRLADLFASTVTYERTSRRKPHPDPLQLACSEMEVAPAEDVWYIGDSESDCRAATTAGLSFAWASWGYGESEPEGCHVRLESLPDALDL
jgi:phosphoglycolate phosphatase